VPRQGCHFGPLFEVARSTSGVEGGSLLSAKSSSRVSEFRWSDQAQRFLTLAAELTDLKMDVIVTADATAMLVAKRETRDIPIVAAVFVEDPVATGLLESLRHPDGNLTGISILAPEMSAQQAGISTAPLPSSNPAQFPEVVPVAWRSTAVSQIWPEWIRQFSSSGKCTSTGF
jgi:hypothetical protein